MRDAIGNRLKPGDILYWKATQFVAEVIEVGDGDEPRVEVPGRKPPPRQGLLTLKIMIPVDMQNLPPGAEPMLSDFIRVVNPKSEELLDRALGGPPPRGPAIIPDRKQ